MIVIRRNLRCDTILGSMNCGLGRGRVRPAKVIRFGSFPTQKGFHSAGDTPHQFVLANKSTEKTQQMQMSHRLTSLNNALPQK